MRKPKQSLRPKTLKASNTLRIIGGEHRSRRLQFPDVEGLRPTTDKIRETLFNWLSGEIQGKLCLDVFAGSGALGFEALSRGAHEVFFLEKTKKATDALKSNVQLLRAEQQAKVIQTDALRWLQQGQEAFDVIFLDPPFGKGMIQNCTDIIANDALLMPEGYLYVEMETGESWPLNASWECLKSKTVGQVQFGLFKLSPASALSE